MTTPCQGQHALFDSTDPDAHDQAAVICATCPVIDACRVLLADVLADAKTVGIEGTWAGQLFGARPHQSPTRARRSDRTRKSQEVDQAIVNRFLAGEDLPTTNAEKVLITAHWLAMGRSRGSLERRSGWKLERYMNRERKATS